MLRVRDIMTRDVQTLPARGTLDDAAAALALGHVGGVPVLNQGRIVGILSKTDLVVARRANQAARIEDIMTPFVHFVRPEDEAQAAVDLMLREGIHRLVVIGDEGRLEGIVTPTDVMRAVADRRATLRAPERWPLEHADPAEALPAMGER
jgi:CBS-domain-containing membrane protein